MLDEVVEAVARLSVPRVTEGSTSLIGLPILLDDELIGVIGLTRAEVGLFSDEEVEIVTLALQAHEAFAVLAAGWRKRGTGLGLGIGIAAGYATIGRIGFEGRYDYGALGRATNLAAPAQHSRRPGEILLNPAIFAEVEGRVEMEPAGDLHLKGFSRPVAVRRVVGLVD